ncbi:CynX/NimT family MFS transporter [Metabacillus fastidiosus]|uniref:MFS transporter n=1 Tax=Metabacillus fastidiosus TaxID=1458 RepID=A0ABU6P2N1_9BACI|nr:MFS transporter [Metabacillus fastidiosus]MED4403609.1 MFS transporter [Metabacillus fastidiosus]
MKNTKNILMMIALFIVSLNLRPAIASIAPLLETIRNDLGMSASVASLLTTIPVFCMGIFSPIAAKLGVRFGMERVIGWALVLIGIGTFLRLFTNTSTILLVTAFLAGVGIAATGPLLSGFIKKYFSENAPTLIAFQTVAITFGASLSAGVTAPIEHGIASWKGALSIWAILALVALPVWWFFVLRNVKKEKKDTAVSAKRGKLPWGNKKAWLLTMSFALMSMMFYTLTAWVPPIVHNMGYSQVYAGNTLTVLTAVQIPLSLLLPVLLKWQPSRLLWLVTGSVLELVGLFMIFFGVEPWVAVIFLGIGAGILFPLNMILPIDMTTTGEEAAGWSAMTQSAGYMIGASGPLILGRIFDTTGSFHYAIIFMIAVVSIMMVIQFMAVPRKEKQLEEAVSVKA